MSSNAISTSPASPPPPPKSLNKVLCCSQLAPTRPRYDGNLDEASLRNIADLEDFQTLLAGEYPTRRADPSQPFSWSWVFRIYLVSRYHSRGSKECKGSSVYAFQNIPHRSGEELILVPNSKFLPEVVGSRAAMTAKEPCLIRQLGQLELSCKRHLDTTYTLSLLHYQRTVPPKPFISEDNPQGWKTGLAYPTPQAFMEGTGREPEMFMYPASYVQPSLPHSIPNEASQDWAHFSKKPRQESTASPEAIVEDLVQKTKASREAMSETSVQKPTVSPHAIPEDLMQEPASYPRSISEKSAAQDSAVQDLETSPSASPSSEETVDDPAAMTLTNQEAYVQSATEANDPCIPDFTNRPSFQQAAMPGSNLLPAKGQISLSSSEPPTPSEGTSIPTPSPNPPTFPPPNTPNPSGPPMPSKGTNHPAPPSIMTPQSSMSPGPGVHWKRCTRCSDRQIPETEFAINPRTKAPYQICNRCRIRAAGARAASSRSRKLGR